MSPTKHGGHYYYFTTTIEVGTKRTLKKVGEL